MTKIPRRLTAENGAKASLIGEFYETIEVIDPDKCDCGTCMDCMYGGHDYTTQDVFISWDNIKKIWAMAYDHFEQQEKEV